MDEAAPEGRICSEEAGRATQSERPAEDQKRGRPTQRHRRQMFRAQRPRPNTEVADAIGPAEAGERGAGLTDEQRRGCAGLGDRAEMKTGVKRDSAGEGSPDPTTPGAEELRLVRTATVYGRGFLRGGVESCERGGREAGGCERASFQRERSCSAFMESFFFVFCM